MFTLDGLYNHYQLEPLCRLLKTDNSPCEICHSGMANQNRLSHYKVHADRVDTLDACFLCLDGPHFPSADMLSRHIETEHTWPKNFTCGYCFFTEKNPQEDGSRRVVKNFLDHLKTCWMPLFVKQSVDEQDDLDLGKILLNSFCVILFSKIFSEEQCHRLPGPARSEGERSLRNFLPWFESRWTPGFFCEEFIPHNSRLRVFEICRRAS